MTGEQPPNDDNVRDMGALWERVLIDLPKGELWGVQALSVVLRVQPSVLVREALRLYILAARQSPEYAQALADADRVAEEVPHLEGKPNIDELPNVFLLFRDGPPQNPEA